MQATSAVTGRNMEICLQSTLLIITKKLNTGAPNYTSSFSPDWQTATERIIATLPHKRHLQGSR